MKFMDEYDAKRQGARDARWDRRPDNDLYDPHHEDGEVRRAYTDAYEREHRWQESRKEEERQQEEQEMQRIQRRQWEEDQWREVQRQEQQEQDTPCPEPDTPYQEPEKL